MNANQRFTWLGVAAVAAISCAIWLTSQRNQSAGTVGVALLPGLTHELDAVTEVSVRKGATSPSVTLQKRGSQWTVAERADYPADVGKLRKLLLNLSDAKIIENKTADPAHFPVIGVEDPTIPGAGGALLELQAPSGTRSVIVGKPVGEGNFVRRGGENQSYIVEPGILVEAEPHAWIDGKLIDIPVAEIQTLAVTSPTGPNYALHRQPAPSAGAPGAGAPGAGAPGVATTGVATPGAFALDATPAGRKAADAQSLAPSPSAFSTIIAENVKAIGDLDFSKPTLVTLALTNGDVVTLTGVTVGDKHWLLVSSSKDAALNTKTSGRAFEIAGYRYDGIFRPLEQLLVPKDQPPDKMSKGLKTPRPAAPHS